MPVATFEPQVQFPSQQETLCAIHVTLVQILTVLSAIHNKMEVPQQKPVFPPLPTYWSEQSTISIDELVLSVRTEHCLKNDNIRTVAELCAKTRSELLRIPNFGRKSLREVEELLQAMGLTLTST